MTASRRLWLAGSLQWAEEGEAGVIPDPRETRLSLSASESGEAVRGSAHLGFSLALVRLPTCLTGVRVSRNGVFGQQQQDRGRSGCG